MNTEYLLELLNGDWGIASLALAVICGFYLGHEGISRRVFMPGGRRALTQGMRNAVSIGTLSLGVAIRSIEVYRWRLGGADPKDLSQSMLLIGAVLALAGFLCTIREISRPLYGDGPWLWTLAAIVGFSAGSIAMRVL